MSDKIHSCCDPTSPCTIWEGKPVGEIVTIDGIEMYISKPEMRKGSISAATSTTPSSAVVDGEGNNRVILFLTEAHSIYFLNAQLLADSFSRHLNCDIIMPDQFDHEARVPEGAVPNFLDSKEELRQIVSRQDSKSSLKPSAATSQVTKAPWPILETKEEFEEWKKRHEPPVTDPILKKVVQYIYTTYGKDVKIGGVGYCFGGRYVIRLMGSGVVDVGVINHPSFFTMEEVGKLGKGKSLAIYAAETDNILPPEKRRETEDVLTKCGATWMSTAFSGTEHGFSVRGDLSVKEVRIAKERAFQGAVAWFADWM
jgi:dienelactone hydrolase